MKILVTGGAGYIGTPLCTALARAHEVVCWDPGFFGFFFPEGLRLERVERPVQAMTARDLERIRPDWILHLSGLSNDPMADFAPRMNWVENMEATAHVGALAADRGARLLFASSASVYGFNDSGALAEDAVVRPIGHYSKSKAAAEAWLLEHHPSAVILRQATVMGSSPRMRFDLLTNAMTKAAWRAGRLTVLFGGRERRPQIHVADLVRAYERILEVDLAPGVYNVGSRNDSVLELAHTIGEQLAATRGTPVGIDVTDEPRQHRSYELKTDRLAAATGWEPRMDLRATVDELCAFVDRDDLDPDDPRWYNIRWMKLLHQAQDVLQRTGPIDTSREA